jgi:hypothetical protein
MEQYKKILGDKLFKGSQLSNFQLNTFLTQDNRQLPLGQQEVNVNEYEQFVKERNSSTCYRLSGVLRGLFSNVLFNVTGNASYETILSLTGNTGLNNPNISIFQNFGYKDILLETDGWFYYIDPVRPCNPKCTQVYMRPEPNDFYFLPKPYSGQTNLDVNNNPIQNWYFKITYPAYTGCSSVYFQSPYITGVPGRVTLCDGLAVQNIATGVLNGRSCTYIETPINHGLLVGDQIILRPFTSVDNEEVFNVIGVDGENIFWIDYWNDDILTNIIGNSQSLGNPLRIKRIFQGIESQYLIRTFKAITDLNDYQIYRAGFSNNIFNDPIQLYHYQLDIDTSPYRDYLGRPLTELYLTKIKYTNYDGLIGQMEPWTLLSVGLETNQPNLNYDVRAIYGGSPSRPSVTPPKIIGFVSETDTDFFGDIVDYNMGNLTERVLVDAQYRFNTQNREDNFYGEGYYYRAHDKIQLLEYSSQIEQENLTLPDVGVPDYAVVVDGVTIWRDILTPGFIDAAGVGVDYPFLNGCHYVYTEHDLCVRRQNPEQNQIYSASVTSYSTIVGGNQSNNYDFLASTQGFGFSVVGNAGDVVSSQYLDTISFNNIATNNGGLNVNGTRFTAPEDGIYPFIYNINITQSGRLPQGVTGNVVVLFTHHSANGTTISQFNIGIIPPSILSSGSVNPINFSGTRTYTLNQGEYITVDVYYTVNAANSAIDFNVDFDVTGSLSSTNQVVSGGNNNNNNNAVIESQNYWLSGINCDKLYGEYIEPVDGEC